MRVLMVLLALVAMPFVASVSQDRTSPPPTPGDIHGERHSRTGHEDVDRQHDHDVDRQHDHDDDRKCEKDEHREHRERDSREADEDRSHERHARHHREGDDDEACGGGAGGGGSVVSVGEIHGKTFLAMTGNPPLSGWVIQLTGPVNRTATSDNLGNYAFTGLPPGTYTVCEVQQNLYLQTVPASGVVCSPLIYGYSVILTSGQVVTGIDFGSLTGLVG